MDKLNEKRVLITGSNGQLGQKLADFLSSDGRISLCCTSKGVNRNPNLQDSVFVQLDLLDTQELDKLLLDFRPSHVIHTAAITSVEACQTDTDYCKQLNVDVVAQLAQWCAKEKAHLTFLSTDFVFDGEQPTPYQETDPVSPRNRYGQSKVEAEQVIQQSGCRAATLRTILVYGVIADQNRSNLVLWAKSKLETGQPIQVVSDQWRMPTWVDDLARATITAMHRDAEGIYHISSSELFSILDAVYAVATYWKLDQQLITPIPAERIGQATNRPRKTGFILHKAKRDLDFTPTSFGESLVQIDKQIDTLWH